MLNTLLHPSFDYRQMNMNRFTSIAPYSILKYIKSVTLNSINGLFFNNYNASIITQQKKDTWQLIGEEIHREVQRLKKENNTPRPFYLKGVVGKSFGILLALNGTVENYNSPVMEVKNKNNYPALSTSNSYLAQEETFGACQSSLMLYMDALICNVPENEGIIQAVETTPEQAQPSSCFIWYAQTTISNMAHWLVETAIAFDEKIKLPLPAAYALPSEATTVSITETTPESIFNIIDNDELNQRIYQYCQKQELGNCKFYEQGKKAILAFYQMYEERFPSVVRMASKKLRSEIQERFGLEVDPDEVYFMLFNSAVSSDTAFTGWDHVEKPIEYGTLTSYLFNNFPPSAQNNIKGLDTRCGIYKDSPNKTHVFDYRNEIKILPSAFVKLVWEIDFYEYVKNEMLKYSVNNAIHIKKIFMDFVLGLGSSKIDQSHLRDCLNGSGILAESSVSSYFLSLNGYVANEACIFHNNKDGKITLYLPHHDKKFFGFNDLISMRTWIVKHCSEPAFRKVLSSHFKLSDLDDGFVYNGLDSWLNKVNELPNDDNKQISMEHPIKAERFFETYYSHVFEKLLSDIDVLIKSDSEVTNEMLTEYIDASNVLPNPISPVLGFFMHLKNAFEATTKDEKDFAWAQIKSDLLNLLMIIVVDSMLKLNVESPEFIGEIKKGMAAVKSEEDNIKRSQNIPKPSKSTDKLSVRLKQLQEKGMGGKGSKEAAKNWMNIYEERRDYERLEPGTPEERRPVAIAPIIEPETYIKSWEKWVREAPAGETVMRRRLQNKLKDCLSKKACHTLDLSLAAVGKQKSLPELLPPCKHLIVSDQETLIADQIKIPQGVKEFTATGCQLNKIPVLPDSAEIVNMNFNSLDSIPVNLPDSIKVLHLDYNYIASITGSLPSSLETLSINYNELSTIPDNLPPGLKCLMVKSNRLESVPRHLPSSIETINISDNLITYLPEILPENLETLIAYSNQIAALPSILPVKLKKLVVSRNKLTSLPDLNDELIELIADENMIDTLPQRYPSGLKKITLNRNRLIYLFENLPDSIEYLSLIDNNIASLPSRLPKKLRVLFLDNNQLTVLPKNLPTMLNMLSVDGNQLRSLSENLPDSITDLSAANNQISRLPNRLPKNTRKLNFNNNQLTELTNNLPSKTEKLFISHNQIHSWPTHLPDNILKITADNNEFTALPSTFPGRIIKFSANRNRIEALPLIVPATIKEINLRYNRIVSMPESLTSWPNGLVLNIENNPLTDRTIQALHIVTAAPEYNGPRIYFSQAGEDVATAKLTLNEAVTTWLDQELRVEQDKKWSAIADNATTEPFKTFLLRLHAIRAARSTGFKKQVSAWLVQLADSPTLREKTFALAQDSTTTCEDRVACTWNQMQTAATVAKVEAGNFDEEIGNLIEVALRMFRLAKLETIAREKEKTLNFVDEVEIFLAFQVKLRQVLKLDDVVDDMRFFDVSYVTEDDLIHAVDKVQADEKHEFADWLSQWDPWKAAMKRIDPELYGKLTDKYNITKEEEFEKRLQHKLQTDNLPHEIEILVPLGKQIQAQLEKEISRKITKDFLQQHNLEHLISNYWPTDESPHNFQN